MNFTFKVLVGCMGVLSMAAAPRAAAISVTPTADAFTLASAFAPSPGSAIVSGLFVESSNSLQSGTFIDGDLSVGFSSGIVLSTGDVTGIQLGASGLSSAFAGNPGSTASLLAQIPGIPATFTDTIRLSLDINPGILNDFVNFSFGYSTNEISPSDRFGLFVDGAFMGVIGGAPVDQGHPWIATGVPQIGFSQALYEDGNPLNVQSFVVSLSVPSPGTPFAVDIVLADAFDDANDTAVFLGDFSATPTPSGVLAVPEPSVSLMMAASVLATSVRRRRKPPGASIG